jgi:hypothetical protein
VYMGAAVGNRLLPLLLLLLPLLQCAGGLPDWLRIVSSSRSAAERHTHIPQPVCWQRRVRTPGHDTGHMPTFAAPSGVEFRPTGPNKPCHFNPQLGRHNQLLPVTHTHDAFGRGTNGVWMYHAEGCSDLMWNASHTLAAPNKIDAAIQLLLKQKPCAPSNVTCAKRLLLKHIIKLVNGRTAEPGTACNQPLCGYSDFCAVVRGYPFGSAACPQHPWAKVARATGCPFDALIYPLLRSHGYDSLQLLASPQGRDPMQWRTELWDVRDTRTQDEIEVGPSKGRGGRFLKALRCKGAQCRPTSGFADCMECEGCVSACVGHVHVGPPPSERDDCRAILPGRDRLLDDLTLMPRRRAPRAVHPHPLPVFNLGMIKTGTTSLDRAMSLMRLNPCKWKPAPTTFRLADMAAFARSPRHGNTSIHHLVRDGVCGALSDNPWWMLYPSLLTYYPEAKFILTVKPGTVQDRCQRWLRSANGTWQDNGRKAGGFSPGYRSFHRCVFGSNELNDATKDGFLRRCRSHDANVMAHAKAMDVPLLVLPTNWSSVDKWRAVGAFLNVDTAKLQANTNWPHAR